MVNYMRKVMADQVREHFSLELRGLSAARGDDAVAVIASLTSVESWEQFREVYGRSAAQTRRAWTETVTAVLDDGAR